MQTLVKQTSRLFLQFPSFFLGFYFWSSALLAQKVFFGSSINFMKLLFVYKTAPSLIVNKGSNRKFRRLFLFVGSQILSYKKALAMIWERSKLQFSCMKFTTLNYNKKLRGLGSQSGFVLVWLTLLAPVLLGLIAVMSSLLIMQYQKQKSIQLCRERLMEIQSLASSQAKKLLSLNPQAANLRIQLHLVNMQILAAAATGQVQLLALLKARRLLIRAQQKSLDLFQKNLIRTVKTQMSIRLSSAHFQVRSELESQKLKLSAWARSEFYLAPRPLVQFAFKPMDLLLAPQYQPYLTFEKRQSLALSWVQNFNWGPIMQAFSMPTNIRSQCRVTLKEVRWEPIIQRDRL